MASAAMMLIFDTASRSADAHVAHRAARSARTTSARLLCRHRRRRFRHAPTAAAGQAGRGGPNTSRDRASAEHAQVNTDRLFTIHILFAF